MAAAVAEEHCRDGMIDPEQIIRAKRISLSYGNYADGFDGMLEHLNRRFHIYCNLDRENLPGNPRGRCTLSHELGHYFIDEHRNNLASGRVPPHPSFADKPVGDLVIEREADLFASNLLMPPLRFKAAAKREAKGLVGVEAIAEGFSVSMTCAAIRYVTAAVIPCVIVKWSAEGFQWKWCSHEFWQAGLRKTIEVRDRVAPESATGQSFSSSGRSNGVISTTATASYWFSSVAQGGRKDIILKEEAIALGRFGVLTMLSPADSQSAEMLRRLSPTAW